MFEVVRRHLPVAITAAVVSTLFAGGPSLARAAADAVNADKVDGKHAVAARASVRKRAGKLVATNRAGLLPNNIIKRAPDAAKLDGLTATHYLTTGGGKLGSTMNINSCGAAEVMSYRVTLDRKASILAMASSTYGRGSGGPDRPTMRIQLLDSTDSVVAQTGRMAVDATTGNPALSISGVLLKADGSAPYTADPGTYTLQLWGALFGACASFGQFQSPELTHAVLAAG